MTEKGLVSQRKPAVTRCRLLISSVRAQTRMTYRATCIAFLRREAIEEHKREVESYIVSDTAIGARRWPLNGIGAASRRDAWRFTASWHRALVLALI